MKGLVDFYMDIAVHASKRSTCLRRNVGAVAIKDDRIIATGRNGQVSGSNHCQTCLRDELDIPSGTDINTCRAIHAEQNMFVQAALFGVSLKNSTIYCTHKPCFTCMKMLLSIKPQAIIWAENYPCDNTDRHLQENRIVLWKPSDDMPYYRIYPDYILSCKPLVSVFKGSSAS